MWNRGHVQPYNQLSCCRQASPQNFKECVQDCRMCVKLLHYFRTACACCTSRRQVGHSECGFTSRKPGSVAMQQAYQSFQCISSQDCINAEPANISSNNMLQVDRSTKCSQCTADQVIHNNLMSVYDSPYMACKGPAHGSSCDAHRLM